MVEMGFEVEIAKPALKKAGSDLYKALDILREESFTDESIGAGELSGS
jgi:hypothetical protein